MNKQKQILKNFELTNIMENRIFLWKNQKLFCFILSVSPQKKSNILFFTNKQKQTHMPSLSDADIWVPEWNNLSYFKTIFLLFIILRQSIWERLFKISSLLGFETFARHLSSLKCEFLKKWYLNIFRFVNHMFLFIILIIIMICWFLLLCHCWI